MILTLNGMEFRAFVGIYEAEQEHLRPIIVNVEMELPDERACKSDDIHDTIDYVLIYNAISKQLSGNRFGLIEHVADEIAKTVFLTAKELVSRTTITVVKPNPYPGIPSSQTTITRTH